MVFNDSNDMQEMGYQKNSSEYPNQLLCNLKPGVKKDTYRDIVKFLRSKRSDDPKKKKKVESYQKLAILSLHSAATRGDLERVKQLTKVMPKLAIDARDNLNKSALELARESHHNAVADYLHNI